MREIVCDLEVARKFLFDFRFLQTSSILRHSRTYYEILGVQNDCSQKEIRSAFVQLSKEYHPDLNKSNETAANTADFIKLMEAYQVLSKTHSRANYDLSLKGSFRFINKDTLHEPWKGEPTTYYGVRGIGKVSNWSIVTLCLVFCILGAIGQGWAINKSRTMYIAKKKKLFEQSEINNEHLVKVKNDALKYGNSEQIERMKGRMRERGADVDT